MEFGQCWQTGWHRSVLVSYYKTMALWCWKSGKANHFGFAIISCGFIEGRFACFILLPYIQRWCPDLGLPKSPNAKTFSKPNWKMEGPNETATKWLQTRFHPLAEWLKILAQMSLQWLKQEESKRAGREVLDGAVAQRRGKQCSSETLTREIAQRRSRRSSPHSHSAIQSVSPYTPAIPSLEPPCRSKQTFL